MMYNHESVDSWLTRAGRCPREVNRLPHDVGPKATMLQHAQFDSSHDEHWNRDCQTSFIAQDLYQPQHSKQCCDCMLVQASSDDIETFLCHERVPLFTVHRNDAEVSLALHSGPMDDLNSHRYVAISHARSAGLGNDHVNGLPGCQLLLLESLINDLVPGVSPVLFWIDTLCLPLKSWTRPSLRYVIQDIFRNAEKVVVIDPLLLQTSINTPHDGISHIQRSLWMTRVWTMVEGMLTPPESLMFQFRNKAISLRDLYTPQQPSTAARTNEQVWEVCTTQTATIRFEKMVVQIMNDVVAWTDHFNSQPLAECSTYLSRTRFYTLMRLSCLVSPKFRPIRGDEASQNDEIIRNTIMRTYSACGAEDDHCISVGDTRLAIARLRLLEENILG
ncbi:hypothetical protein F5Y15DRAFT_381303 [Xylariaceae sp. FL0016]|nr:hypothetical protein F5Y15DRAFT_381303 [Xylariaceae sp. FL0016]